MNLYEIDNAIMDCVDEETGDIIDEQRLDELQLARDIKIENIACWIKDLNAEAKALKEEKDNLDKRKKVCENKADSLKKYLQNYLGGEKFKTSKCAISYRNSESVEVSDVKLLTDEYLKFAEPTANKTAIKEALKSGEEVAGASLIKKVSIQIK